MATISKYQTASGATLYRVRYRTPDRRQTQKRGFKTKRDARAFAATVEVQEADGRVRRARRSGRITVGELAPDWLTRKQHATAPSHYRMLESAWRVHVQPQWGTVSVADVDLLGVEAWIAAHGPQGRGCHDGPAGARRAVGHPGRRGEGQAAGGEPGEGCGEPAAQDGQDATSTCRPTTWTGWPTSPASTARWSWCLAYCGIRWGEAIALRVRDVEFLRRRLTVHGERRPARRRPRRRPDQGPQGPLGAGARVRARRAVGAVRGTRQPDDLVFADRRRVPAAAEVGSADGSPAR